MIILVKRGTAMFLKDNKKTTYIIAEAGVNHNGSLKMALDLIDAAASAGADAVKFQTFLAKNLARRSAPKAEYQKQTMKEESQFEMLSRLELAKCHHQTLLEHCASRKIDFLSTPFDEESLSFLTDELSLRMIKLGSGEITNAPLLLQAARRGVSVILSTGMSTLGEVESALSCLAFGYLNSQEKPSTEAFLAAYASREGKEALERNVTLLHCTTEYPAPFEDVNLLSMLTLKRAFNLPVGYSDHTQGIAVPVAAAALGASVIEKHFTLDKGLPGPDHRASLEPGELSCMVQSVRQVEASLGNGFKIPAPSERENRIIVRKSLVAKGSIPAGTEFSESNLCVKRPGTGISPFEYWSLLGRKSTADFCDDEEIRV